MHTQTKSTPDARHPAILASLLTAIAGYLDAIGFSEFNNIFVSFMSGNTTRLGTALVSGQFTIALATLAVILCFVAGAALGGFVADRSDRPLRYVLIGELALLFAAMIVFSLQLSHAGLCLLAVAMGLQNASFQSVNGATVGKTFMTGTLVSFGQGLGRAFSRGERSDATMAYGLSWLIFASSVVIGAVAWSQLGGGLSIALCLALVLALVALVFTDRH